MPRNPEVEEEIQRLRDLYRSTRGEVEAESKRVREAYERQASQEVAKVKRGIESRLAREIRSALDRGVPTYRIRAEVLKTNAWERWLYWRDYPEAEGADENG